MKTDLSKVFTISGEQGLFSYVAQATKGSILESLSTKKRTFAGPSAKMSALSDISLYTTSGDVKLQEVFEGMHKVLGEASAPDKKSEPDVLKEFFAKVIPDYDRDRFYPSHMKKVVEWYAILREFASLEFEVQEEGEKEGAASAEPVQVAKSATKASALNTAKGGVKGGKSSTKAAGTTRLNVPRKAGNS